MKRIFMRGEADKLANYVAALTASGAEPVVSMDLTLAERCDGLLLPGGADADPALYGQENTASEGIDPARDRDELELIKRFFAQGKPILGICRGHQMLNIAFGGTLIQDVENRERHVWKENGDSIHPVRALHPFMQSLYGEEFPVNSAHHQAVGVLAKGLIPTCESEEGINEGFIHENGKIIAVQFHPERIAFAHARPDAVDGSKIFDAFLALIP